MALAILRWCCDGALTVNRLLLAFPWYPPPQATPPSLPADLAQAGGNYHIANRIEWIYLST
ncbi:MAG: hypothetical protein WBX04_13320 [Candidatus Sulfotelmatobacter sp.]|jgi:hypothetical protein